jgi:hypothetical protein
MIKHQRRVKNPRAEMTSLSDLYELNTKQYRSAAERFRDPVYQLILLQMVRAWLDTAALPAPTQEISPSTGAPARSEKRAA